MEAQAQVLTVKLDVEMEYMVLIKNMIIGKPGFPNNYIPDRGY